MTFSRSTECSPYTEFAKLCCNAKYSLSSSAVMPLPLASLPLDLQQLEINGDNFYGYEPLQERIAQYTGTRTENVVAATGTSFANHMAMAACFEPGDDVLIEAPTYDPLLNTASFLGANVVRFPRKAENAYGIDPADVRKNITSRTKLIVLCNLHNPTSALVENDVLREIGAIAAQHGARVLVDEVYLEAVWERPGTAFHLGDQFVAASSLTKAYGLGGLRCGWILAEPKLAQRMWRLNDLFGSTAVHIGEQLSVVAFDHLDKITARSREIVETNRKLMWTFLDGRSDLACERPQYGTTVALRLLSGCVEHFHRLLREKYETSVVPGEFFEMPEHMRVGLGGDQKMTAEALERFGAALDEFSQQG